MLRRLLSIRVLGFRNLLTRAEPRDRARARWRLLTSLIVAIGAGLIAYSLLEPFAAIAQSDDAARDLLARAPSSGLFTAFWLLVLSGITVGIQTFYLNPEMNLLLSAPIRPRPLFMAKLVDAMASNGALFLSVAGPIFIAYSAAMGILTPIYFLALLAVLGAFVALPTSLGVLGAVVLMRILPAGRTRDALAAVGIALFALAYFLFTSFTSRIQNSGMPELHDTAGRMLAAASNPILTHGPWAWGGAAVSAETSNSAKGIGFGLICLTAAGSMLVFSELVRALFFAGWATMQETDAGPDVVGRLAGPRPAANREGWRSHRTAPALLTLLPPPIRAVYVKDMLTLKRDMRQLSMLFIPITVIGVFIANLDSSTMSNRFGSLLVIPTLLVILAPISLRLSQSAWVAESRPFWIVLGAPNSPFTALLGKFAFASTLSLPIALAATGAYVTVARLAVGDSLYAATVVVSVVSAFSGIGVGASARFGDFRPDGAQFALTTAGRFVIFGLQIGLLIIVGALSVAGVLAGAALGVPRLTLLAGSAILTATVSGVAVVGMLSWGARRLRVIEWS